MTARILISPLLKNLGLEATGFLNNKPVSSDAIITSLENV